MLLILLTILWTSCTSCPKENEIALPAFPTVPSPIRDNVPVVSFDIETEVVSMPMWYWRELTTYMIETEAAIERLKIDMEGSITDLK